MNEGLLILYFALLTGLALVVLVYPLKAGFGKGTALGSILFILLATLAYQHWGAWAALQEYHREQAKQAAAKAMLATIKSPAELVEKLKAKLDNSPASAHGWYLLGRVYASQNQWLLARDVFLKSTQLNPDDELAAISYGESLWQLHHQTFDETIRQIFLMILTKNPNQPDTLAMLARDAYERKDYQQAKRYWQTLLTLVPLNSREAKALQKAIARVPLPNKAI